MKKVIAQIAKRYNLSMIIVFGSVAQNKTHAMSDVDVAYSADRELSLRADLRLRQDLFNVFHRYADLIFIPHAPVLLMKNISDHGKLLYGREGDFKEFKRLTFHRYVDYAPYFEQQISANKRQLSHAR